MATIVPYRPQKSPVVGAPDTRRGTLRVDSSNPLAGVAQGIGNYAEKIRVQTTRQELGDVRKQSAMAGAEISQLLLDSRTTDLDDPNYVENNQEQISAIISRYQGNGNYTTPQAAADADLAYSLLGQKAFASLAGSHAERVGQLAVQNFTETQTIDENAVFTTPSLFEDKLDSIEALDNENSMLGGMDAGNRGVLIGKAKGRLADAAARGLIEQNPWEAERRLKSGYFDKYIEADQRSVLLAQAESEGKIRSAKAVQGEVLEIYVRVDKGEATEDDFERLTEIFKRGQGVSVSDLRSAIRINENQIAARRKSLRDARTEQDKIKINREKVALFGKSGSWTRDEVRLGFSLMDAGDLTPDKFISELRRDASEKRAAEEVETAANKAQRDIATQQILKNLKLSQGAYDASQIQIIEALLARGDLEGFTAAQLILDDTAMKDEVAQNEEDRINRNSILVAESGLRQAETYRKELNEKNKLEIGRLVALGAFPQDRLEDLNDRRVADMDITAAEALSAELKNANAQLKIKSAAWRAAVLEQDQVKYKKALDGNANLLTLGETSSDVDPFTGTAFIRSNIDGLNTLFASEFNAYAKETDIATAARNLSEKYAKIGVNFELPFVSQTLAAGWLGASSLTNIMHSLSDRDSEGKPRDPANAPVVSQVLSTAFDMYIGIESNRAVASRHLSGEAEDFYSRAYGIHKLGVDKEDALRMAAGPQKGSIPSVKALAKLLKGADMEDAVNIADIKAAAVAAYKLYSGDVDEDRAIESAIKNLTRTFGLVAKGFRLNSRQTDMPPQETINDLQVFASRPFESRNPNRELLKDRGIDESTVVFKPLDDGSGRWGTVDVNTGIPIEANMGGMIMTLPQALTLLGGVLTSESYKAIKKEEDVGTVKRVMTYPFSPRLYQDQN